jgi:hypothetical protein
MTNCAELDGVTNCYRCYAALCGTGATPKRVKHLLDGSPMIVSNAPTAELATPAAREMCETMMQTMRTLAGRRTHATQYGTIGGRMQLRQPRPTVWQMSNKQEKQKYCKSALKHLAEAPLGGRTNFETYDDHVETSQRLFLQAENVILDNVGIVLGIRINSETDILDSVGNESLLGDVDSEEQPLHCDLAPDGTAQNILAVSTESERGDVYAALSWWRGRCTKVSHYLAQVRHTEPSCTRTHLQVSALQLCGARSLRGGPWPSRSATGH